MFRQSFDWIVFLLTLLTTIFLQVLSNLANDYGDAIHGADHEERKGPKRMVSSGKISPQAMSKALVVFSILSLLSGLFLLWFAFGKENSIQAGIMLLVGLCAIWAALKYTVGDRPYGYDGFGDLFVLLFFGLVAVLGAIFLQVKTFYFIDIIPAFAIGFLAVGVLNVNNMRDIESDSKAAKNTIPVRLGLKKAKIYHTILIFSSQLLFIVYVLFNDFGPFDLLFIISYPLLWIHLKKIWLGKTHQDLDPQLKVLSLSSFLLSFLFFISQA